MMVIYPYREQYTWVFDDERVGLVREPFVQGVPEMINLLSQTFPMPLKVSDSYFQPIHFPDIKQKCCG